MYLTYYIATENTPLPFQRQINFQDLFNAQGQLNTLPISPAFNAAYQGAAYRTIEVDQLSESAMTKIQHQIGGFNTVFKHRLAQYYPADMSSHYNTFQIPKASGGMRTINEPDAELKNLLREIKDYLHQIGILAHTCAYAYVPGRAAKDAVKRHIKTQPEWYLHLDLHNFFGSCNSEFIYNTLNQLPFFHYLPFEDFRLLIHAATLNDGLPQGTPLSPWLTNQLMVPFDHQINRICRQNNITYTRYADDLLFSSKTRERTLSIKPHIETILQQTPLTLNENKTRLSSIYGKNWQLGLMLNQNHQATIGTKRKERCRAALHEFCLNPESWDRQTAMEFQGKLAYYKQIEPEYFEELILKYNDKFETDIYANLRARINS